MNYIILALFSRNQKGRYGMHFTFKAASKRSLFGILTWVSELFAGDVIEATEESLVKVLRRSIMNNALSDT